MKKTWTQAEVDFLLLSYPTKGQAYCAQKLNRTIDSVERKAHRMGLRVLNPCSVTRKPIIKRLSNGRVISLCDIHGQAEHYDWKPTPRCITCTRKVNNKAKEKQRSTRIGYYSHLLSCSLRKISSGKFSFTKNLPYNKEQLCSHLEDIRESQNNHCPMCDKSYEAVQISIDHIYPTSLAKDVDHLLRLFDLSNLSLLCVRCNTSKGNRLCL